MSRPSRALLFLLAAAVALPMAAHAQQKKRRRRRPASTDAKPNDKAAFEQIYALLTLQSGKSYLREDDMPEPDDLDAFIAPLPPQDKTAAEAKKKRLQEVVAAAECVQQGPGSIPHDVYKLMIQNVADDLEVGAIVEQEFTPSARAHNQLTADEKALIHECEIESRSAPVARRAAYQQCLGRRKSESVYFATQRLAARTLNAPVNPACGPVLEEVEVRRPKVPAGTADAVGTRLAETRKRLLSGILSPTDPAQATAYSMIARQPANVRPPTAQAAAELFKKSGPVSPFTSQDLKLDEPPLNSADLGTGQRLAQIARNGEIGFTGKCYAYTKAWLEKAGIVKRRDIDSVGLNGSAYQFAQFVDKHPALLKRKLRRIPQPQWPLPIGTTVVWAPGACGYNAEHGHIEIITRIAPPQACSDGCGNFQWQCLDELSSGPARAQAQLPPAQAAVASAQAAYDSDKTRANLAALRKAKATLADVERRLNPRVAAYVVEREPVNVASANP